MGKNYFYFSPTHKEKDTRKREEKRTFQTSPIDFLKGKKTICHTFEFSPMTPKQDFHTGALYL